MFELSTIDVGIGIMFCLAVGFVAGVVISKENGDGGRSNNVVDLPGDSMPGSLRGSMGPGRVGDSPSSPGGKDNLDHRSVGGAATSATPGPAKPWDR